MGKATDFYEDLDKLELELHQANITANRMSEDVARADAQEMINLRSLPKDEAWDGYFAEESRKLN